MKRKVLSKSEIKELNQTLSRYAIELSKKDSVIFQDEKYYVNNTIVAFVHDENVVPTLFNKELTIPKITIDLGAVKFLLKGADMMRPGITTIDTFEKGAIIGIQDEEYNKLLGIGIALFSSEEMKVQEKGKSVATIHYYGDVLFKE